MMKAVKVLIFLLLLGVSHVFAQRIDTVWVDSIPIEMVLVEGGTFQQGCMRAELEAGQCLADNQPAHTVTLKSYYIAKFEVTRQLYSALMGEDPSYCNIEKPSKQCPVETVSWYDAQRFIDTLNQLTGQHFRLPTEAEWEYAARGGKFQSPYLFAGSDVINKVAWRNETDPKTKGQICQWTKPVGRKSPNALGLYDMTCNVAEWCSDWFSPDYYSSQTTFKNPKGPLQGSEKVCRGGSWGVNDVKYLHLTARSKCSPDSKKPYIGFRLAMDTEPVKH